MAIIYDWYKNPSNKTNKDYSVQRIHPRINSNGKTDTGRLCRMIQESCSLTKADVEAALAALSEIMARDIADGRRVHLRGIGYFSPTLGTTCPVTESTVRKADKVVIKGIEFEPDKDFRAMMGSVSVRRLHRHVIGSTMGADEVDRIVAAHFRKELVLTNARLMLLCGMRPTTAARHIKRLLAAGAIRNIGTHYRPVYVQGGGE